MHTIICTLGSCLSNGTRTRLRRTFESNGVQFSEAVGVFSDDYAITINDDESDPDAQRLLTLGMGIKGRILVVVYCYSGENIRIISARTAGRPERDQYEAQR